MAAVTNWMNAKILAEPIHPDRAIEDFRGHVARETGYPRTWVEIGIFPTGMRGLIMDEPLELRIRWRIREPWSRRRA